MELLFKAFDEESFSHHGKHYTVPAPVEFRGYQLERGDLVPRPNHRHRGRRSPSGKRSIHWPSGGIKGMVTLTGEAIFDEWVHLPGGGREGRSGARARRGPVLGRRPVPRGLARGSDPRVEPYHDERYKWFAPFGIVRYADARAGRGALRGAVGRPVARDGVAQGLALRHARR